MSLYWRKCKSNPIIDLPKKIMRPFWHPVAVELDDQVFSTVLHHQRPKYIPLLYLVLSLVLFYFSLFSIISFKPFSVNMVWTEDKFVELSVLIFIFLIACLSMWLFVKMIKTRSVEFNRKHHQVHSFRKSLLPRNCSHDYDELQAAIECYKNPFGKRKSWLVLKHASDRHKINLCFTYSNPQQLVGYWSFIVQYMKIDAPLPDVAALHHYPDITEGVSSNTLMH